MRLLTGLLLLALATPVLADNLSPLAPKPVWSKLNGYQRTITHDEFARLVNSVYSVDGAFWLYATLANDHVTLFTDASKKTPEFTLAFAASESAALPRPYAYKTRSVSGDPKQPLRGIKIALDPGHIGGDWAKLEGRYFKLGDDPAVMEANLNLITAKILAERLESDGATIAWAKHGYEPTTDERPDTLHHEAIAALSNPSGGSSGATDEVFGLRRDHSRGTTRQFSEKKVDIEAGVLFYRSAEIRARAERVNAAHPDLTICIHYNADDWGDDPDHPHLVGHSSLIIFVNGSYEKSELAYDDGRYDLMRKLLDRTAAQEMRGCALVGREMLNSFGYPPDVFNTSFAHRITDVPSVYSRDLLANRLYHGPVIYCEGPYMNAPDAYYRIIAGDYLGQRMIKGERVPSIYRQYAFSVEKGVLEYFAK